MLLVETKAMLVRVLKKDNPPIATTEQWLHAVIDYLEQTKNQTNQIEILEAIDKLTAKVSRNHENIEENTTVIRKTITDLSSHTSSSPFNTSLSPKSWSSIAAQPAKPAPKPAINKDTEVIVRLNDKDKKEELRKQDTKAIIQQVNEKIKEFDITTKEIRAIKQLQSGDIAIHTVNAEEANKLRDNSAWTTVMGPKARTAIQTHAVMISGVEAKDWNLSTPETRSKAIQTITKQNQDIEAFEGMDIVWIGWRVKPAIDQQYATMIIEVTDPVMGNAILNESLVVGRQLRACSIFNKAARSIQCFKCYKYGHITTQCSHSEACGHCAGEHSTRSGLCTQGYSVKCCACGGAHKPWEKSCPKKREELQRIRDQVAMTPSRFPVRGALTARANARSYFDTTTAMDWDITKSSLTDTNAQESRKTKPRKLLNRLANFNTPDTLTKKTISSQRSARSRSPTKRNENTGSIKDRRDEAEKGGDYVASSTNRSPLGSISENIRETRSNSQI